MALVAEVWVLEQALLGFNLSKLLVMVVVGAVLEL